MSLFINILSKFFGNKSDRDIKEILPIVDMIRAEFAQLQNLSNDQLRAKSQGLKQRIADSIKEEDKKIKELKLQAEDPQLDMEQKQALFSEVDEIEKGINDT